MYSLRMIMVIYITVLVSARSSLLEEFIPTRLIPRSGVRNDSPRGNLSKVSFSSHLQQRGSEHLPQPAGQSSQNPRQQSSSQRTLSPDPQSMRNAPIRIGSTRSRKQRIIPNASRNPSTSRPSSPSRLPSPPRSLSPPQKIQRHQTSAMIIAQGPGAIKVQRSGEPAHVIDVPSEEIHHLSSKGPDGTFASGVVGHGGRITAASTGNAATGYAGVASGGAGFIQMHNGPIYSHSNIREGIDLHKHATGDDTGLPKAAMLASVEGPGHANAIGMDRPVVLGRPK